MSSIMQYIHIKTFYSKYAPTIRYLQLVFNYIIITNEVYFETLVQHIREPKIDGYRRRI